MRQSVSVFVVTLVAASILHLSALPIAPRDSSAGSSAAKPNPDADGNYHIGDGVTAPKVISAVDPYYTKEAREKHMTGIVVLWVLVKEDGSPADVRVAHSLGEKRSPKDKRVAGVLDDNARKAVERYRFEPGRYHGKPVPIEMQVTINYRPD